MNIVIFFICLLGQVSAKQGIEYLDEYLDRPEPVFKWECLLNETFKTVFGGTAYMLNVTSLEWRTEQEVTGLNGSVWSHIVYVVVPKEVEYQHVAAAYITGSGNWHPNENKKEEDTDVILIDKLA